MLHMLKWDHEPERRSRSWVLSIEARRNDLTDALADNPGLKPRIAEAIARAFRKARIEAAQDTGLGRGRVSGRVPVYVRGHHRAQLCALRRPHLHAHLPAPPRAAHPSKAEPTAKIHQHRLSAFHDRRSRVPPEIRHLSTANKLTDSVCYLKAGRKVGWWMVSWRPSCDRLSSELSLRINRYLFCFPRLTSTALIQNV